MNRKDFLKAGLVMIGGVWVPKQHGATIIVRGPRVGAAAPAWYYGSGVTEGSPGASGIATDPTIAFGPKITLPTGTITKYSIYAAYRNFDTALKFALHNTSDNSFVTGTDHTEASVPAGDGVWKDFVVSKAVTAGTYYVNAIGSVTNAIDTRYASGQPSGSGRIDYSATYAGFPTLVSPGDNTLAYAIRVEVTP